MIKGIALAVLPLWLAGCFHLPALPPGPPVEAPPVVNVDPEYHLFELINAFRHDQGLATLRLEARLQLAARDHAEVMAIQNCLAHQCLGEDDLYARLARRGFPPRAWGETIYVGWTQGPQAVVAVDRWTHSPVHLQVLKTNAYEAVGCAILEKDERFFYVCDFGTEG